MTSSYTGGCACGGVRYEVSGEPLLSNDCQCRDCQRESGTGHGSYVSFLNAAVTVTGAPAVWDMVADSGTPKRRHFCRRCGTAVFMTFPTKPEIFTIRAGSLDDPGRYRPEMVFFTARGQAWDRVDPALTQFSFMPAA